MAKRLTVVISQGQSAHPDKRRLEEDLVTALLIENKVEVVIVPHLYDLTSGSTGALCLEGIAGDLVVASWLFPRAAHWTLDRQGVRGHFGLTQLKTEADEDDEEDDRENDSDAKNEEQKPPVHDRPLPPRSIYHLDLRAFNQAEPYLTEIRRLTAEAAVQTVQLSGSFAAPRSDASHKPTTQWPTIKANGDNGNAPSADPTPATPAGFIDLFGGGPLGAIGATAVPPASALATAPPGDSAGQPQRINETPNRRWYPVIDYSRCTNCMECIDFCLFGVYGVDGAQAILVEQPDNCRKGCPACSRVCPENAIIFPQHKTPSIAGSATESAGGLKIDLSQLFGAPSAIEMAALERDVELVAVGRDAVGLSIGIPKRQADKPAEPKDDLDALMDQLDDLSL
jgi:NAD-dependent dihydropyrimidine dehydrogenase PreA subunit